MNLPQSNVQITLSGSNKWNSTPVRLILSGVLFGANQNVLQWIFWHYHRLPWFLCMRFFGCMSTFHNDQIDVRVQNNSLLGWMESEPFKMTSISKLGLHSHQSCWWLSHRYLTSVGKRQSEMKNTVDYQVS